MRAWIVWVAVFIAAGNGFWMVKGHFSNRGKSAAYEAAPACADGRLARDCRSKEPATISDKTVEKSGRSTRTYWLVLRVADGNAKALVTSAQYAAASKGESLDIERWSGYVTRIYRHGIPEAIVATPRARSPMLVMGIGSLVVGLGLVWVALKVRRKQKLAKASRLA